MTVSLDAVRSNLDNASQGGAPPIHKEQGKHVEGHNNYKPGRSKLTGDPGKLAEQAGTGQQVGDTPVGEAGSKERVDFGEVIGQHVDGQTGETSDTTKGMIHYDGQGKIHIVPAKP